MRGLRFWQLSSDNEAPKLFRCYSTVLSAVLVILISETPAARVEGSMEGLTITDLAVVDSSAQRIQTAMEGDEIFVRSVVANNADAETTLAYVVQVKDPADRVVFLSLTTHEIISADAKAMETVISPGLEGLGNHSIQVFVWENVESPPSFSFASSWLRVVPYQDVGIKCGGSASCISGTVTRIIDGDTMVVNNFMVRLTLIDTPKRGEAGFQEATSFTESICAPGTDVLVDEDDGQTSGSYGRMVAKVYCVGGMTNEELLRSKNAVILTAYCERSEFGSEEWAIRYGC